MTGTTESIAPLYAGIPDSFDFQRNNYAWGAHLDELGYVTYAFNISGGMVGALVQGITGPQLEGQARAENISVYDPLNREAPREPGNLLVLPYLQGMGGTPDAAPGNGACSMAVHADRGSGDVPGNPGRADLRDGH